MGYPGSSGSASTATTMTEEKDYQYSNESDSPASTSPSSLTPTLPVTPRQEDKQLTFPSSSTPSKSSPFPTTSKRTPFTRRRPSREVEEEEEEDCGCGSPPEGFDDSDDGDDLDVLDFVLRDQTLALKTTSSSGQKAVGETGLGLFKRPGVEGLSLTPGVVSVEGGGPPPALSKPTISVRRPSTAPAAISTNIPATSSSPPRSRHRTISNLIPKLRLPRPGSSESDDSTGDEREDSDETMPGQTKRRRRKSQKKQFDRFMMPSDEDLLEARQCELVGETGVTVTLDDLIKQRGRVVFVGLVS